MIIYFCHNFCRIPWYQFPCWCQCKQQSDRYAFVSVSDIVLTEKRHQASSLNSRGSLLSGANRPYMRLCQYQWGSMYMYFFVFILNLCKSLFFTSNSQIMVYRTILVRGSRRQIEEKYFFALFPKLPNSELSYLDKVIFFHNCCLIYIALACQYCVSNQLVLKY